MIRVSAAPSSGHTERHTLLLLLLCSGELVNVSPACDDVTAPSGKKKKKTHTVGVHDHPGLMNVCCVDEMKREWSRWRLESDFKLCACVCVCVCVCVCWLACRRCCGHKHDVCLRCICAGPEREGKESSRSSLSILSHLTQHLKTNTFSFFCLFKSCFLWFSNC